MNNYNTNIYARQGATCDVSMLNLVSNTKFFPENAGVYTLPFTMSRISSGYALPMEYPGTDHVIPEFPERTTADLVPFREGYVNGGNRENFLNASGFKGNLYPRSGPSIGYSPLPEPPARKCCGQM